MVQQDIKTQDLEAGTSCGVVREAGGVVVLENRVSRDESFNDNILNISPHLLWVVGHVLQMLVERRKLSIKSSGIVVGKTDLR